MTPGEMKYLQIQFKHLNKQNQAILVYLAHIMTPEQHKKADEFLKMMNTRPPVMDPEEIKKLFTKLEQ